MSMPPIVFISRSRIKPGKRDAFAAMYGAAQDMIREAKPKTALFAAYLDDGGDEVRIVHVFGDAQAMDLHLEGSGQRSEKAYEIIEPAGFEVLGAGSAAAVDQLRRQAASAGTRLDQWPTAVGGWLRGPG